MRGIPERAKKMQWSRVGKLSYRQKIGKKKPRTEKDNLQIERCTVSDKQPKIL